MRRPRPNLLLVTAGMAALAFLLVMIVSGRTRPMQSLVAFEAAGLMREAPDQIDRVDLEASGHRWTFAKREDGWRLTTSPEKLMAGTASHLEMSLKFMHVAAPARVMSRDEYQPGMVVLSAHAMPVPVEASVSKFSVKGAPSVTMLPLLVSADEGDGMNEIVMKAMASNARMVTTNGRTRRVG